MKWFLFSQKSAFTVRVPFFPRLVLHLIFLGIVSVVTLHQGGASGSIIWEFSGFCEMTQDFLPLI
ncbi:MAG TPA: hypothetical protein DD465_08380 [Thalassospira sp.]|nr:hypothetical protein [Thalassospira sp.]